MQVWCMAHPWMTLFLATLMIVVSGTVAVSVVALRYYRGKDGEGETEDE